MSIMPATSGMTARTGPEEATEETLATPQRAKKRWP